MCHRARPGNGTLCGPLECRSLRRMARLERLTVQVAPDVRAEIESAASKDEVSCATIMRQALRDWALRRELERRQEEGQR